MSLYSNVFVFFILFSSISYSATVTEELSMLREEINDLHVTIRTDLNKTSESTFDVGNAMSQGISTIVFFNSLVVTISLLAFLSYMKKFKEGQLKVLKELAVRTNMTDKEVYNKMKKRGVKLGK